jgi:site-specific DNA-methyltransferase (cytosine-N4-specific)
MLGETCEGLAARLERHVAGINCDEAFPEKTARLLEKRAKFRLPNESYLQKWFAPSVLLQLRLICAEIACIADGRIRDVANVILSDILREVSLQDPADLRIRRRSNAQDNYPAVAMFISLLRQRTRNVIAAGRVLGTVRGRQRALLADSRRALPGLDESFDAVITSPPYATALPYLDTQRLSLAFLGLLSPKELRVLENEVIGNREISRAEREREEALLKRAELELPAAVVHLCSRAQRLAAKPGNGFRRRNVPALLVRYFRHMRDVLRIVRPKIRSSGSFAMVVGPNRTTLDGEMLVIDTPHLLGVIAESVGWKVEESLPLDAYQRFDLHRQNSITTERLIVLRRAS